MFQRLKGAIDSRISEEIERQKQQTTPVSRTNSLRATARPDRNESPNRTQRKQRSKDYDAGGRSPDPKEFENAFVIEDESTETSRAASPYRTDEKAAMAEKDALDKGVDVREKVEKTADVVSRNELPQEVRTKLKKLDALEAKYKELLRSYRIAHGRAIAVEPFEKVLKEHTPVSGIGDPGALVEYLTQLKVKGDMVMQEYTRVSQDRDEYKKKFEEAEKQTAAAREELARVSPTTETAPPASNADSTETPASIRSPVASILGVFSPKPKQEGFENKEKEEFFSFDDEIPKLQTEVKERAAEVEELKEKVSSLEKDLATAQEASSGLVGDLEKATRELNETKEASAGVQNLQEQIDAQTEEIKTLKENLGTTKTKIASLEADLGKQKNEADAKVASLELEHASQKETAAKELDSLKKSHTQLNTIKETLESQIKELEESKAKDIQQREELSKQIEALKASTPQISGDTRKDAEVTETPAAGTTSAAKKKNKKKKKGGAATSTPNTPVEATEKADSVPPTPPATDDLQVEISKLKIDIIEKDAQIEKLQAKRKTEEELREEVELLRDELTNYTDEHVQAKQQIKDLQADKATLQQRISKLEEEIEGYKGQSKASEKVDADFKALTAEFESLKLKSATLQTDLGAAQQLATSRYRDLTDLKDVLTKAQPELKSLRAENENLKATKNELATRTSELRRLEAREKDLKADVASFKKQATDRDAEVRTLNEKITQETNNRLRFEDLHRVAQRDLRKSEAEKIQIAAAGEKAAAELDKVSEEAGKLRSRVRELEGQVEKLTAESKGLREEVQLRGEQYNNAQGLLGSMRNQSQEMAMQLKEAKDQSESLEEELAEVQRLLSERTREGETMRRLVADVDDRADAKVREMRERMEIAIEERDRAEDEASTNSRRRAREVEELKSKIRDLEKDIKRATDDRDELERSEKEHKRKRDELEALASTHSQETNEIRSAMGELRSALDGSEKQVRDAEKQRSDLRRLLDESTQKYDKLQKEFRSLQAKQKLVESSRNSMDSSRALSPSPKANGGGGAMDYVYLKTILLQFLEQKDRKVQADLVRTVLGQLLHFDKKDQEKWIAAISAK